MRGRTQTGRHRQAPTSTPPDKKWVVYCKEPFACPRQVVDYIGRYTHRIAISNRRTTGMTDDAVFFRRRDPKDPSRSIPTSLPPLEFIRRFLQHVLPSSFIKIRHGACPEHFGPFGPQHRLRRGGILANRNRRACIARVPTGR